MNLNNIKNLYSKELLENCYNLIKNNRDIIKHTNLEYNKMLSEQFKANIFLKREDQQIVRSFKIRGSFNKIYNNKDNYDLIVSASAGNHAQGVSYVSNILNKNCKIFLPVNTPKQKIDRIKHFGKNNVELIIYGNNVDESLIEAKKYSNESNGLYVHPFNDSDVILGQSTIMNEIYEDIDNVDYVLGCVGGGGLVSGVNMYRKIYNKKFKLICGEPENANSMYLSLKNNEITSVSNLDTFVDGAAVRRIGNINFELCKDIDDIFVINKNELCYNLVNIYQNEGIVLEPAGILGLSCLNKIKREIQGKNVVVILSGGNNDILRYNEILERSLIHQGLKHYFIIYFNQKPGELKRFVNNIMLKDIDITRFEYLKKTNKDKECVLLGIELNNYNQYFKFIKNLNHYNYNFEIIDQDNLFYKYLV